MDPESLSNKSLLDRLVLAPPSSSKKDKHMVGESSKKKKRYIEESNQSKKRPRDTTPTPPRERSPQRPRLTSPVADEQPRTLSPTISASPDIPTIQILGLERMASEPEDTEVLPYWGRYDKENRSIDLTRTKQLPPSVKASLEKIKNLALVHCKESEITFNECDIPPHVFLNLEELLVSDCLNLASFDFLIDVYNLGREKRTLNLMNKGANFFDRANSSSDKSFDLMFQLKVMRVEKCPKMARLLPSKVGKIKDILPLEKLEVRLCESMLQLFPYEHKPMAVTQLLPNLVELNLWKLPQLESVLHPFQCLPNLRELRIENCGLRCLLVYHEMEMAADPFPMLKKLVIKECKEMSQMISSSSPDPPLQGMCIVFKNLCDLIVEGCPRLTHLFWSKQAKHMQHLTSLTIDDCESLRAMVISNENQEQEGASTSTSTTACMVVDHHGSHSFFPRLSTLRLSFLPRLESVLQPFQCLPNLMELRIANCGLRCFLEYHEMGMAADPFPKLKKLVIEKCKEMNQMISSSSPDPPLQGMCIVFKNLCDLIVEGCRRLTHLFWSKQAKHMQHMKELTIPDCESLTAVISNENQEQEGASTSTSTSTTACMVVDHHGSHIFQNLSHLSVDGCPRLNHLFLSKQAKHMQQLTSLDITDCESLRAVVISNENQEEGASASTSTSTTACVVVDHHHGSQYSFFPGLTKLNLSELPQLESVLQPFQCLPNLMELRINDCGFKFGLAYHHEMEMAADPFPKLKRLEIIGCMEMSQMISSSSPDAPLQGMCIVFKNLCDLIVEGCPRLNHLFLSKQAKHMQQLTSLEINDCDSLTAVVISNENQEHEGASTSTSTSTTACMVVDHLGSHSFFPRLGKLKLYKLPKIVAFHQPTASLIELSFLKRHFIRECPILEATLLAITTRRQDVCNQMDWQKKVEMGKLSDEESWLLFKSRECPILEATLLAITTRRQDVCNQMDWQKKVEMGKLSDEESWLLFKSRAGNVVESPTMKVVAWNVAKECVGQPLALVALGTALKSKNLEVWKTVLKQLKKSKMALVPVLQGVSNQLRESIELSYNFLESEEAKLCFLHCCLYPEDYDIEEDDLMHMLVGGGILEDVESLHEAQDRVHVLMDQLKASCLLLEGGRKSNVRMHHVVRDVAIRIGERDHGFFVRAGQDLEEWPRNSIDAMKLQNCRRLSLMSNEIVDLPSNPINCTKLETLILCGNRELSNIPENFFQHMKALKVLDLSFTNISCLPESLSCLTSLRVLNLKRCEKLRDISPINWLRMFGILILEDFERVPVIPEDTEVLPYWGWYDKENRSIDLTRTKQLPPSVKASLEKIKNLTLVHCKESEITFNECDIPPHVFLNLKELLVSDCLNLASFDFLIDVYNLGREKRRSLNLMNRGANFFDIAKHFYRANSSDKSFDLMFQLKVMRVEKCPKMARLLPSKVGKSKDILPLEKLEVILCGSMLQLFPYDFDYKPMAMTKLLPKLKSLELVGLPELKSVLQPFQCLPNLMELRIENCGLRCGLAYHEMEMAAADPFPKLEKLKMLGCSKMSQMIFSSSPDALQGMCIFQNLTHLSVARCPRLTNLFWSNQAKLEILELQELPRLESVLQPFQCLPNLMTLEIRGCGLRYGLGYHEREIVADPFPKLKKLVINRCSEMSQMFSSSSPDAPLQGMSIIFQNLCHLEVYRCPRLTHLFWSKQAKHMQQLTSLVIKYCDSLTTVVISNEIQEEKASASTSTSTTTTACAVVDHHGSQCSFFPRLTRLILKRLPKFAVFHQSIASPMEWQPCLEEHFKGEFQELKTPLLGPQTSERSRVFDPDEMGFEEDSEEDVGWDPEEEY